MKAPTWVALALCIGRALPSKTVGGDHIDQCEVVCHAIKSEISSAEACTKARKSLPRPKIGRVCQEAFEKALELMCVEACQGHVTGRVPEGRLGEACDQRRREVPRPVTHKACVDGFNAGFAATTAFIAERVELEPQMDEETKVALLEQHDLIPKEVAAEFDYFMELDSPEETEQAQNMDVPKLGGITEGFIGNVASTDGMTLRGVDENQAGIPLRKGSDRLTKDASTGKGDLTTRLGPEFMEVLKAEHVEGFKGASKSDIGNQVGEELIKIVPEPAEEKESTVVSAEANLVMELPQDGRFQETLTVDHIKAYNNPSIGDKPRSDHGRSRPARIKPGPAEETARVSSEENLLPELAQDGRFQEVLTVDHIKAYNNPSSGDKPRRNRGRSHSAGIVPGSAEEKETADVSSEASLVTKLLQGGRVQGVLTVDHMNAYNNKPRSSHDRLHPLDATSRTDGVPISGAVELEDFVTLGQPEPPLSENEKRLEALSAKETHPRDMQQDEVATLELEGNE